MGITLMDTETKEIGEATPSVREVYYEASETNSGAHKACRRTVVRVSAVERHVAFVGSAPEKEGFVSLAPTSEDEDEVENEED